MAGKLRVFKRGKTWSWRFSAGTVNGKRVEPSKGGFPTRAEAVAAGTRAMGEWLSGGVIRREGAMSVSDYLDLWLSEHVPATVKATTAANYTQLVNKHIRPALGGYRLASVDTATVQRFINKLCEAGYSRKTVLGTKAVLSSALAAARTVYHLLDTNPIEGVRLPSPRSDVGRTMRVHERGIVSRETWAAIMARFPEGHPAHVPLVLGYRCGLRLGEVFGLQWSDVDLEGATLSVVRQMQRIGGVWRYRPPKYDSARRMHLDASTVALLRREKARQDTAREELGPYWSKVYTDGDRVGVTFGDEVQPVCRRLDGTQCSPITIGNAARVIHGHRGPLISSTWDFHSLRHTHCSMLLEAGAPIKAVQERLGHKDVQTTLRIYTHCTRAMEERTVELLESMYRD